MAHCLDMKGPLRALHGYTMGNLLVQTTRASSDYGQVTQKSRQGQVVCCSLHYCH